MKTQKRKLNVKLLRKIQRHISDEPRRFSMSFWGIKAKSKKQWREKIADLGVEDVSKSAPPCNTTACIAGTANLITGGKRLDAEHRAAKILGIPFVRVPLIFSEGFYKDYPLFHVAKWPKPFSTRYKKAETPRQRAKIACARIDHLIKTGE
jgi:hypothetical protein